MRFITNSVVVVLLLLSSHNISKAQEINVNAIDQPLNEVLIEIINTNDLNISFDDNHLAQYIVNTSGTFSSIESVLDNLLEGLPLDYEIIEDVWVIYPMAGVIRKKVLSGKIYDSFSSEPLPYSHITVNKLLSISDGNGYYSLVLPGKDSIYNIKVSHLGYYIYDTIVNSCDNMDFSLIPSVVGLSEITVKGSRIEKSTQAGDKPGLIKLNHKIADFLPGYGDNSVFNLIRLMPGILASGEQTNELIIWGGYAGHSKVIFDGFTIYGLNNFNDNISSFNPFITKDIEIHKGGYEAKFGGRVGGIVNITGKNGNPTTTSATICINNMTINGMVEIPILQKGSLIFAFRHTYYNLYNPSDMTGLFSNELNNDSTNNINVVIKPDYQFRDANLKYSTRIGKNDDFYISLHSGEDRFNYSIYEPYNIRIIDKQTSEENIQHGGSVYYNRNWNNGNSAGIRVSGSSINSLYTNKYKTINTKNDHIIYRADENNINSLEEYKLEFNSSFLINETQTIESGVEYVTNIAYLEENDFNTLVGYLNKSGQRLNIFVQDRLLVNKHMSVIAGGRVSYAFNLKKFYAEPRISLVFNPNEKWKITSAMGLYNQFIALTSTVDEFGNFRYLWTLCDNVEIPVLSSTHFTLGTSYHNKNFTISAEGYYKTTSGLTRFIRRVNANISDLFYGRSESYGIDLLVKQEVKRHSAWLAYSLGKTMESFDYYIKTDDTRRAPQDQRHELKIATLLNFDPVFLSSSYIYGSGFPYTNSLYLDDESENMDYNRFDLSVIYKFLDRKIRGETGVSILNVLNTTNIKYASFEKIPTKQLNDINFHVEALPRTLSLYLKLYL